MLLIKKGYPKEEEFVFCQVLDIQHHSVFCKLDEYDNRKGMMHISEVASGRIKNIREYVKIGKKIVCKVLRVDNEKGHIDLSLRRVNESQRRAKLEEMKQELQAEKIIESVAREQNIPARKLFDHVYDPIIKHYDSLYICFEDTAVGECDLEKLGLDKAMAQSLTKTITERIKPPEVRIGGLITLATHEPQGIESIKEALRLAEKEQATIRYAGAGMYTIEVVTEEYKTAEEQLKKALLALEKSTKKHRVAYEFKRKE